jgi:hypothetical protein
LIYPLPRGGGREKGGRYLMVTHLQHWRVKWNFNWNVGFLAQFIIKFYPLLHPCLGPSDSYPLQIPLLCSILPHFPYAFCPLRPPLCFPPLPSSLMLTASSFPCPAGYPIFPGDLCNCISYFFERTWIDNFEISTVQVSQKISLQLNFHPRWTTRSR